MNHNVTITLSDGREYSYHNLVVGTGLAFIASRFLSNGTTLMDHMAIGTGNTTNTTSLTALTTEVARVALTSTSVITTTVTNDTVEYVAQFAAGVGTATIQEIGIFNASSGGIMLARVLVSFVKDANTGMTVTWKVKF